MLIARTINQCTKSALTIPVPVQLVCKFKNLVPVIIEEYASEDKGGELLKRKITIKNVPPDVAALKAYLDISKQNGEFDNLTDSELKKEKVRLLKLLKKLEDKNEISKT